MWTYGAGHWRDASAWLIDLATGQRRSVPLPSRYAGLDTMFSADETKLVWYLSAPTTPRDVAEPHFDVYDIPTGHLHALPIKRGSLKPQGQGALTSSWGWVRVARGGILFTCDGPGIYWIGLDGSGLERVFPRRQPLTIEEFDAETSGQMRGR